MRRAFAQWLAPLRQCEWVVYAKRPFAGPAAVLAYLSRYTHRVAISNQRLIALDERGVTFRWKDYRAKGSTRYKTMTLSANEFMRRFLLHVLPGGFHRIRHCGLFANAAREANLAKARALLHAAPDVDANPKASETSAASPAPTFVCRECGAPMIDHRHLAARTAHPRATQAAERTMSASASRHANRPPALVLIRADRARLCLAQRSPRFPPARHLKLWRIDAGSTHRSAGADRLRSFLCTFGARAEPQIPIAR